MSIYWDGQKVSPLTSTVEAEPNTYITRRVIDDCWRTGEIRFNGCRVLGWTWSIIKRDESYFALWLTAAFNDVFRPLFVENQRLKAEIKRLETKLYEKDTDESTLAKVTK